MVAVLALLAGLLTLSYPLLPVNERTATYHWNSEELPRASLVLNPWRPTELTVSGPCQEGRFSTLDTRGERVSGATGPNSSGLAGQGLDLRIAGPELDITSGDFHTRARIAGCERFTVHSDRNSWQVETSAGGQSRRVAGGEGDISPVVNGLFVGGDVRIFPGSRFLVGVGPTKGWEATVVADTGYDSSPSKLKVAVGIGAATLLLAATALTALAGATRRRDDGDPGAAPDDPAGAGSGARGTRETLTADGSERASVHGRHLALRRPDPSTGHSAEHGDASPRIPWWVEVSLPLLMVLGLLISGTTDDDGFIAQIIGTPSMDGYIGNYVRWNNAPEAPFGWFYELYSWWGRVSHEPVWLRIPPLLLGLAGWLTLRALLNRLLPSPRPGDHWTVAAVAGSYLSFWLVFCNSLRPEIMYALGTGLVTLLVYDALTRRTPWRLVVAAVIAGLSIGAGPTGLVALGPFVVAAAPLWRWARRSPASAVIAVALAWLAGLGSVVLLMFNDQTLATVVHATRVRTDFGPVYPIWQDYLRYWRLFQSYAGRQVVIYLAVVALLFLAWRLIRGFRAGRRGSGHGDTPGDAWVGLNRDLLVLIVGSGFVLVPAMALSPTKLPHHFGALALLGPLAIGACLQLLRRARPHPVAWPLLVGGGATMAALSLHQNNKWWKLSTLGLIADGKPLAVAGIPVFLPLMVLTVLGTAVALFWFRSGRGRLDRPWRLPARLLAAVLALAGVLQLANFGYGAISRHGHYSIGAASLAAINGRGCLLERTLQVETEPSRGVILDAESSQLFSLHEYDPVPTWTATDSEPNLTTSWLELPEGIRSGEWPLVVPATGIDPAHRLMVEFDTGESRNIKQGRKTVGYSQYSDTRVPASELAPDATRFRLRTVSVGEPWATITNDRGTSVQPLSVGAPRMPQDTVPLSRLIDEHEVAFAWNLAFFAPCADQPRLAQGRAERTDFVVSDSQVPGNISYQAKNGGPFAGVLAGSVQRRVPIYAPGDYSESVMNNLDLVEFVRTEVFSGPRPTSTQVGPPATTTVRRSGWDGLGQPR